MTPSPDALALVCSVALEAAGVEASLDRAEEVKIGGKRALRGSLAGRPVILIAAGMGKTNAAHGLTALLEGVRVAGVIGFGVGGAYPGSGLETGGIAVATREIYGDEGVAAPEGWLSTREIGIPLADGPLYNEFDLESDRVAAALRALGEGAVAGPFVTVSTCSGTLARGTELAGRYGAICESMEGAAYAHVCALYATPFLEVRGISNLVEDREMSRWHLRPAALAAARAVAILAGSWSRNSEFNIQNSKFQ